MYVSGGVSGGTALAVGSPCSGLVVRAKITYAGNMQVSLTDLGEFCCCCWSSLIIFVPPPPPPQRVCVCVRTLACFLACFLKSSKMDSLELVELRLQTAENVTFILGS